MTGTDSVRAGALLLLVGAAACLREPVTPAAVPAAAAFSLAERVGWVHGRCLAIGRDQLARGAPVMVVITDEPQRVRPARIGERTADSSSCPPLLAGRVGVNGKSGVSFYRLDVEGLGRHDMGIAIVDPPATPTVVNGRAKVVLDPKGAEQVFSSCLTSEGVWFRVWSGEANKGEPRWSGYNYLGYDVTPTCP